MQRFGVRGKFAPRYIGPYPIVERCGPVAYRLDLPANLSAIHNIFHVSQLRKCLRVLTEAIESDSIQLESDLTYSEYPIKIIDHKDRVTRRSTIKFYKVQWSNHSEDEATWEQEEFLRSKYPDFLNAQQGTFAFKSLHLMFSIVRESWDEILLRGKGCNTPVLILVLISCLIC